MKRFLILFVLAGAGVAHAQNFSADQIRNNELTGEQAQQVLIIVLKHEKIQINKRGMDIDGPFKVDPNIPSQRVFWEFGVIFDSPKYGATQVLSRYAVSRLTGDVWDTDRCKRYNFSALRKIQAAIMHKTGKALSDETEARRGLGCTDD